MSSEDYLGLQKFVEKTDRVFSNFNQSDAEVVGTGREYHSCRIQRLKIPDCNVFCAEIVSQPQGLVLPPHSHPETHVRLLILKGDVALEVEGYMRELSKGERAIVPAGFRHTVFARSHAEYLSLHEGEDLSVHHDSAFPPWVTEKGIPVDYPQFAVQLLTAFLAMETEQKSWLFLIHVEADRSEPGKVVGIARLSVNEWGGWKLSTEDRERIRQRRKEAVHRRFLLSSFMAAARRNIDRSLPNAFVAYRNPLNAEASCYSFRAVMESDTWKLTIPQALESYLNSTGNAKELYQYLDYIFDPHLPGSNEYIFFSPPTYPNKIYRSFTNLAVGSQASDPVFFVALQAFYLKVVAMLQQHEFSRFEKRLQDHAQRSATAAIMSRNLSHNVGSHALANSRFFESVGILHEIASSPKESPTARMGEDSYDGGVFRHKKTNFPMRNGEVWRARQRLSTFNGFIQGRLDFIARALGETSSPPEPLFLFGDLVQGFFSQRVLLNTLLSDNGITIENIEFHIKTPEMAGPAVYKGIPDNPENPDHQLRHIHFDLAKDGGALGIVETTEIKDVLIAVPGGIVGRHAFYAFLENIMRNAAKYGERPDGKSGNKAPLIIRLDVKEGVARKSDDGTGPKDVPCYWMEITDNRSLDRRIARGTTVTKKEGSIARRVRIHLDDPIITPEGKPQSEGHGIQEMKVCASFLAGGELGFPIDEEIKAGSAEVKINDRIFWSRAAKSRDSYHVFLLKNEKYLRETHNGDANRTGWIGSFNSLQAWDLQFGPTLDVTGRPRRSHLAYRLILQKPVIFGIVDLRHPTSGEQNEAVRQATDNATVHYYNSIATLANAPAQFGLILVSQATKESANAVLLEIARHHTALPYRLIIVLPGALEKDDKQDDELAQWQASIDFASAGELPDDPERRAKAKASNRPKDRVRYRKLGNEESALRPGCLPARRVFVTRCPPLNVDAGTPIEVASFQSPEGLKIFQSVYEAWLRAWKGHELKAADSAFWRLWIGFERGLDANLASDIGQKWHGLQNFTSDLIRVRVCVREPSTGQGGPDKRNSDERWSNNNTPHDTAVGSKGNLIVFDNHGKVFTEITEPKCADGAPACHHSFSGSGQIDLFHTLESPPGDPFGLAYLLYSTVEASLMRIVIVDERVAEAMINEENVLFGDLHTKLLNARIYPMFQIQPGTESDTIPLSPAVGEALANVQDEFNRYNKKTRVQNGKFGLKKGESDLSTGEGFHLGDDAPKSRAIRPFMKEQITSRTVLLSAIAPISYVDALVIHEGVADIISSKLGDDWDSSDILAVFSETPGIIRTSGRGSQTRHLDSSLPFVEFTVVGATTYQNLNKVGLSRSLLGVRKGEHDQ